MNTNDIKILYILETDISTENSVCQKVEATTIEWNKLGYKTHIISLVSKYNTPIIKNSSIIRSANKKNFLQKIISYPKSLLKLNKILSEIKPDVIYSRQLRYLPGLVYILKKHSNYIVEINSNDVYERKLRNDFNSKYITYTRDIFFKKSSGLVFVTHELSQSNDFKKFEKPYTVIANGINCKSFNKSIRNLNNTNQTSFVFIGSPNQVWHGLDKIMLLAKKIPNAIFNIIGSDGSKLNNGNENVIFHGYLPIERAKKIVQESDIGIGALSAYKKQMQEGCSLKTRQYLSQGLPIIIGYDDTDFLNTQLDFVLNIGNYENNIADNIDRIKEFSEYAKQIPSSKIYKFAETNLDFSIKETKRLEFITKFLKNDKHKQS